MAVVEADPAADVRGLPPGPRLPGGVQALLAVLATERYTAHVLRRYGPAVTLRVAGIGEFVAFSDPEAIRELFTGDPEVLRAGEANAALGALARSSVVVADGERHLRLRRLLLPPFHGEAMRAHTSVIRTLAAAEVARWPVGRPFATLPRMQAVTLEVILRAVVGVRDPERARRLRAVLPRVLDVSLIALFAEAANPRLFASRAARRLPWLRARDEANRLVEEEIAAHRAAPEGRDDVLAMLLAARDEEGRGLDDTELRDQLLTLLMAGHETTATTLAWAFERLVRHPQALAAVQRALPGEDGEAHLGAVIDETLRTRPVVDQVMRRLGAPMVVGGHALPAGTLVAASILGVQRSAAFADPAAFRPERLLHRPPPPYTLIPFGGGARRCLGAAFAHLEMRTILRAVLERVELEPTAARAERTVRWRRFSTTPSRGGRVTVRRRLAAA
jgi:cytochrome P450 family 135